MSPIQKILQQWRDDPALAVSPSKACRMIDVSGDKIDELMAAREVDWYWEGNARRITVASLLRRIERKLAEAGEKVGISQRSLDNLALAYTKKPRAGRPRRVRLTDNSDS